MILSWERPFAIALMFFSGSVHGRIENPARMQQWACHGPERAFFPRIAVGVHGLRGHAAGRPLGIATENRSLDLR
jgi:hypothetical protein